MKKTRLKELFLVGLSNVVSGVFFGTGCIMIEHADNAWWHNENASDEETIPEQKSVAVKKNPTKTKPAPVDNDELADLDESVASK
jgi:hypothetical protein